MELTSRKIEVSDYFEAVELFFQNRWSDGLAIVPPTQDKVEEMIASVKRDPQEVIGKVPPRQGIATIEKLAINSVMAGCLPEYFPIVVAAVEAILEPSHALSGTQTTTHMNEPLIIVNGPISKKLNFNAKDGVFGRGFRANGTIGRALRLVLWNLGGNYPGEVDKSGLSHPGSWSFCIAEDEDSSPWEPLHVERSFPRQANTVTVFSCEPPHSIIGQGDAQELLNSFVRSMTTGCDNNFHFLGETLIVINSHDALSLSTAGWSKKSVKEHLWEKSKLPLKMRREISEFGYSLGVRLCSEWYSRPDEEMIPMTAEPADIHVVVAGGQYFNAICPGWGAMGGIAISKEIKSP